MPTQQETQQRREAKALLESFWPDVFRFSKPRPLKLGILAELVADAERRGLPFDAEMLRVAIKAYTCRYIYQRALVMISDRIGLDGQVAGEVTPEQKAFARLKNRLADERGKARKQAAEAQKTMETDNSQSDA